MANKKIRLKNSGGDILFPRTSINNLVGTDFTTVVSIPVLDATGKVKSENLPEGIGGVTELLTISNSAPAQCAAGDLYFNSGANNGKIYRATAANTWSGTGSTPEKNTLYINLANNTLYRWNGSAMTNVSGESSATVAEIFGGQAATVLTPGNLHSALSVAQAVDVSCKPYNNSGSIAYVNDDFLQGFTATMVAGTTVGFYDSTTHKFPKFATDGNGDPLHYLFIADVSGTGAITPNGQAAVTLSSTPQRISMEITASSTGFFSASAPATVSVANWRQYEVTALTDEAIAYLASAVTNPNPDALFRSASVYPVLNKYLVKQDMVSPWIPTISMPDNSDLTVAAGLSYKIKYTNDNAHLVTVDTIPADAYGWDAHIQMFVKGTAAVQFQPPLILMDALTPNAGHNLLVKFRNGSAYVYVDDLNAGYIVISPTGSADGTLAYGFTMTPANAADDKYIIFGSTVNGLVCDFGTVTAVYGAQSTAINLIGNGMDHTYISGTLTVPSGKTVNMQDLAISGGTISGDGTVDFDGVGIVSGSTVDCGVRAYINGLDIDGVFKHTYSGTSWDNASQVSSISSTNGTGTLTSVSSLFLTGNPDISGVEITGPVSTALFQNENRVSLGNTIIIRDCYIHDVIGGLNGIWLNLNTSNPLDVYISGCTIANNRFRTGTGNNAAGFFRKNVHAHVSDTTLENNSIELYEGAYSTFVGTLTLKGSAALIKSGGVGFTFSNCTLDVSALTSPNISPYTSLTAQTYTVDGTLTIKTKTGRTCTVGSCMLDYIGSDGKLMSTGTIVITGAPNLWEAANVIFASPLDASAASTVKLSGTTFTEVSKIASEPMRIQFPASTTVSVRGNSAPNDTDKIITAPLIMVGESAPTGTATIEYGTNNTSSISGLGTYIAKDGSNDFTADVTSVTAADGLGTALADSNKWTKLKNDLTTSATFTAATPASINDNIITNEYEPILGGTYSVSAGGTLTVAEATKTAAIAGGAMTLIDTVVPKGATVAVSGGTVRLEKVTGNGGTINLNNTRITVAANTSVGASGCTFIGGSAAAGGAIFGSQGVTGIFNSCVFFGNVASNTAAVAMYKNTDITFNNCTFSSNSASVNTGAVAVNGENSSAKMTIIDCVISGNTCRNFGAGVNVTRNATMILSNTVISGNTGGRGDIYNVSSGIVSAVGGNTIGTIGVAASSFVYFGGVNTINKIDTYAISGVPDMTNTVTISSGAIVDLTGNTNATPINPGGGVTLAPGGATVYPSAGSASAYMLGGMTVPQIGNTNVVNLSGTNVVIADGGTAYASGCVFSGGSAAEGGALLLSSGSVTLSSVVFTGNSATSAGNDIYMGGANATLIAAGGNTIGEIACSMGTVEFRGANTISRIYSHDGGYGSVTISSGVSINLADSIITGGDITVLAGGCTVNGTSLGSAGGETTYVSIVNSGGTIIAEQ